MPNFCEGCRFWNPIWPDGANSEAGRTVGECRRRAPMAGVSFEALGYLDAANSYIHGPEVQRAADRLARSPIAFALTAFDDFCGEHETNGLVGLRAIEGGHAVA